MMTDKEFSELVKSTGKVVRGANDFIRAVEEFSECGCTFEISDVVYGVAKINEKFVAFDIDGEEIEERKFDSSEDFANGFNVNGKPIRECVNNVLVVPMTEN